MIKINKILNENASPYEKALKLFKIALQSQDKFEKTRILNIAHDLDPDSLSISLELMKARGAGIDDLKDMLKNSFENVDYNNTLEYEKYIESLYSLFSLCIREGKYEEAKEWAIKILNSNNMFEVDILLPAMSIFYRTKDYEMLDKYFSECENKNNLSSLLSQMLYYMANKNDAKCKKTLIEISKKNPYVICFIANVGNAYEIIDNIDEPVTELDKFKNAFLCTNQFLSAFTDASEVAYVNKLIANEEILHRIFNLTETEIAVMFTFLETENENICDVINESFNLNYKKEDIKRITDKLIKKHYLMEKNEKLYPTELVEILVSILDEN